MNKLVWILISGSILIARTGACQTVFDLVQDPSKMADKKVAEANYPDAIDLYRSVLTRHPDDSRIQLKLAECYFQMKDYPKSILAYSSCLGKGNILSEVNIVHYAEAQTVLKNYTEAIGYYKRALERDPGNDVLAQKIWRLDNINYLFEDSAHYSVRPLGLNTTNAEMCPVPYRSQIVFVSNRKETQLFEKVNGKTNTPFYQLYVAPRQEDPMTQTAMAVGEVAGFARTLKSKFNTGPVDFYDGGRRMVFVSSSEKTNADGSRTLGLYFASRVGHTWTFTSPYPYNSGDYSIHDVAISEDGTRIFFSSNMKGGLGDKDIYSSTWINDKWSKPINLGEPVNTPGAEVFPSLQNGTLYFSSDGHAGMGALDIFKVSIQKEGYGEVENVGYPINSSYDDFSLKFDSLRTHGYFTSNRKRGGFDDDIYEFDMDMQTYPFILSGLLHYKEHTSGDSSEIKVWTGAKLYLVDREKGFRITETKTDERGNFAITIPCFSNYYIEIADPSGVDYKASLEIQKYRAENSVHQIVVVKDILHQSVEPK